MVLHLRLDRLLKRLYGTKLKKTAAILDVGCGKGLYLDELYNMGWKNIVGIDLFIPSGKIGSTKWRFIKGDIFQLEDSKYDCIILNHSFEHMNEPDKVLIRIYTLLKDDGICIISIPLIDGPAWRKYATNYCQIDAPRHFYLYTKRAMEHLCEMAGLFIERILYDSHGDIFRFSDEFEKSTKSHSEIAKENCYSKADNKKFYKMAMISNFKEDGDEAIFYIKKKL
jgi:SAM-dependent methyltransferase